MSKFLYVGQSKINKDLTILIIACSLLYSGLLASLIIIPPLDIASASVSLDHKNNSSTNNTNFTAPGPTRVIKSKPTGNYNNYVNGTYVYSGPTRVIKSKPTGNYNNYVNGTYVYSGPTRVIKSKPTGNYSNGTSLVSVGPPKVIVSKPPIQQSVGQNNTGRASQTIAGKPMTSIGENPNGINSLSKPITKEEAQKAEEQANVMLKAYNEKVNQQAGAAVVRPPVTTTITTNMTATTTNSSQQQKPQQPITQENSSSAGTAESGPIGIPGIP